MTKQRGLGKGLGALLGEAAMQTAQPPSGAQLLPLQKVEPNPLQPRKSEQAAIERAWFTDWTARIFLRLRRAVLASIAHMPTPERILLTRNGTFIRS